MPETKSKRKQCMSQMHVSLQLTKVINIQDFCIFV